MKWEKCGIKRSNTNRAFVWLHSFIRILAQARHTLSTVHNFIKKSPTKYDAVEFGTNWAVHCLYWRVCMTEEVLQWKRIPMSKSRICSRSVTGRRANLNVSCMDSSTRTFYHLYNRCDMFARCVWYNLCMNSQTKFQHILVFFFRCSSLHHFSVLLGFPFVLFSFQINWVTFTNLLQNDFVHA